MDVAAHLAAMGIDANNLDRDVARNQAMNARIQARIQAMSS